MKFLALVSGGKDSCFNILHCLKQGHELIALGNLYPQFTDEMDSFMYQTVGHDVVALYSECCSAPLYREAIIGTSANQSLEYSQTENDETEDLFRLLSRAKKAHPDLEAVSVGAILSSYQRTRVEDVCSRLGLCALSFLWQRDQEELMAEMVESGMDARIIKVAAIGLNEKDLGKSLKEMFPKLLALNRKFQVHVCGEGGEFETLVLDAPFFHKNLEVVDEQVVQHSSGDVYYLKWKVKVVDKVTEEAAELPSPPLLNENFSTILESLPRPVPDKSTDKSFNDFQLETARFSFDNKIFLSNITSSKDTVTGQMDEILSNLSKVLSESGLTFQNIQSCCLLVKDMKDFALLNKTYSKFFNFTLPPSRVCVQTGLPSWALVSLSAVVLKDLKHKRGIHIQGRSYWAPCNIGPYSQAIVDSFHQVAHLSGQIPLIPSSMELCRDDRLGTVLALQHLDRVKDHVGVRSLAYAVAFVTSENIVCLVVAAWKAYANTRNLLIVQVSGLPRGANVEWSGVSYTENEYESDDEDWEVSTCQKLPTLSEEKHYTIYTTPQNAQISMQNAEVVPVQAVWDYQGEAAKFGMSRYPYTIRWRN